MNGLWPLAFAAVGDDDGAVAVATAADFQRQTLPHVQNHPNWSAVLECPKKVRDFGMNV